MSQIELIIHPITKNLGDNFIVRRSLPDLNKKMVGPFIFWDHMGPVELNQNRPMVVRAHPHIGLATITWLFSGEIVHRDSLGNEQTIKPGEVNWMTAGKGIVHSERSQITKNKVTLEGIQLWVALPKDKEQVEPSFYHCKENDLPLIQQQNISMRLIAGSYLNFKSSVPTYSDLFYLNGYAESDSNFSKPLKESHEAALYIVSGKVKIEEQIYEPYTMVIFKKGSVVKFEAFAESNFMFFGGECFPEDRIIWWNFVATNKSLIEDAKLKWKKNEFPPVINEA
ncbi:MAG: pirin family protein, partial [Bdellovibrionales bacterium]|nr:pirin family protein [Bdellovibrionales bacterium]